jgi:uncharacterized protein (DUF924 family)
MTPKSILNFWFGLPPAKWWEKDDALDAQIREKFTETYEAAATGALDAWAEEGPESALALILTLDQFPRNMFRNDTKAFATDKKAANLTKAGLLQGYDLWFKENKPEDWRAFFYIPLMHSENLEDQRRCVDLFATHGPEKNLPFARLHHDIIARFGRFPHRNALVGRKNTLEESAFLKHPGSVF